MALFTPSQRRFAETLSSLAYCNPFLPERIDYERAALGDAFIEKNADWNLRIGSHGQHPNIEHLIARVEEVLESTREKRTRKGAATDSESRLYEDMVLFALYHRYHRRFAETITEALSHPGAKARRIDFYKNFVRDLESLARIDGVELPALNQAAHLFACFFQVRRAFEHIFNYIIGISDPIVHLRGAVWHSIFTHDMRRYRRSLYDRMSDITCLISGPSGTGKELVARAIGLSRYIPFDPKTSTFSEDFAGSFHALNLSALSPTLIESELFGHKRGAFTGALQDRIGWLEICPPLGTVFLDEIGEIATSIQVKLLRVLQTRTFQRLGDTENRAFHGKIIAATNRDLTADMRAGRFREDLYYRLCSDMIITPSLRDQLCACPDDLRHLISFVARRIAGEDEVDGLLEEVQSWISKHMGRAYTWPGNVRELEQCVRNVMVRKSYHPTCKHHPTIHEDLIENIRECNLSADQLLEHYCSLVYSKTGSYQETARRLRIDRRTVKSKVRNELVQKYRAL